MTILISVVEEHMPFHIFKKDGNGPGQQPPPPQPPTSLNLGTIKFKTTNITNDYTISSRTLGVGINGKVVECFNKRTNQKYALKVSLYQTSQFLVELEIFLFIK